MIVCRQLSAENFEPSLAKIGVGFEHVFVGEHCLAQSKPLQSFSGLFAVKEAILKADNTYRKIPFNQLEIVHDQNGKPSFADFSISISHSAQQVVALAIRLNFNI